MRSSFGNDAAGDCFHARHHKHTAALNSSPVLMANNSDPKSLSVLNKNESKVETLEPGGVSGSGNSSMIKTHLILR